MEEKCLVGHCFYDEDGGVVFECCKEELDLREGKDLLEETLSKEEIEEIFIEFAGYVGYYKILKITKEKCVELHKGMEFEAEWLTDLGRLERYFNDTYTFIYDGKEWSRGCFKMASGYYVYFDYVN